MVTDGPTLTGFIDEFNIPIRGKEVEDRIAQEGASLEGVNSAAGRLFEDDPEAFKTVATGIGRLAKNAQGIDPTAPDAFNDEAGVSGQVIHDPATLIASTTKVTRVSAGGGIDTIGDVDEEYKPNYEGPAWRGGSMPS